jgi:hypothetical protein
MHKCPSVKCSLDYYLLPRLGRQKARQLVAALHGGTTKGRLQRTKGYATICALRKPGHVLYDLKYLPPAADSDLRP